jgi:hypothetical protein
VSEGWTICEEVLKMYIFGLHLFLCFFKGVFSHYATHYFTAFMEFIGFAPKVIIFMIFNIVINKLFN